MCTGGNQLFFEDQFNRISNRLEDAPGAGTVGAAMEGANLGIPALAISLETDPHYHLSHSEDIDFSTAGYFTAYFAHILLEKKQFDGVDVLKVEIPRHATPENIERTARALLGRPYLWGANSPKGLDCSGLTKFVFFLNGIDLARNASHQANQGVEVPLDANLSKLKKGDLLFFGSRPSTSHRGRVTHAGIYLGDKLFIHSSERVRINSLDPRSPLRDEHRIRSLIGARRVLPE